MALDISDPPQSWANTYWTEGTGSTTGFMQNGSTDENTREYGLNPWGRRIVLWKCTPNGLSNGGDGGWNSSTFSIDSSYTYRFSCWFRRTVLGPDGTAYFGTNGYGTTNGLYRYGSGSLDTNPYMWIATHSSANYFGGENVWCLAVGHVFSHDTTLTNFKTHSDSGLWHIDGTYVSSYYVSSYPRDWKWHPDSTTARHRAYLYYSDTSTLPVQHMAYPRVDKLDGTEPTLKDLLRDGRSYLIANLLIN